LRILFEHLSDVVKPKAMEIPTAQDVIHRKSIQAALPKTSFTIRVEPQKGIPQTGKSNAGMIEDPIDRRI
jgi:hypothetical protein